MSLGENIKKEREKQGISKSELTRLSTVNRNTIARVESGLIPHPSTLLLIAKALHVSVSKFTENSECVLIPPYESTDLTHISTIYLIQELLNREEIRNDRK